MISYQKSPQKVSFEKILARVFFLQYLRVRAVHKLYYGIANFYCNFLLQFEKI